MGLTHRPKAGALLTGNEWEADDAHLEAVTTVATTGATETLDASAASVYDLTLDQACTFTLTGATDDEMAVLTVILRGAFGTTWPGSVTWLNGAPAVSSLRTAVLFSVDGGTNWYGTSSRSGVGAYDIERRTAGDITISSTSAGAAFPTIGTLTVAASAGDLILIGLSLIVDAGATSVLRMDVGTIVSAAVVNYVSSLSSSPATVGLPQWRAPTSTEVRLGPSIVYVAQSGDLSGGNIELGLRAWLSSANNKNAQASTSSPLVFWAKNLQQ